MDLGSIGRNIRKYRLLKRLRQEDLAEQADLSTNYIGAMERGEKTPSLAALIKIANAMRVSADMLLADVIDTGCSVKESLLAEKLERLCPEDRARIYDVIDALLKHSTQIRP